MRKVSLSEEALLNVQGLIDSPHGRRLFKNSDMYNEVIKSIHKALANEQSS